MGAGNDTMAFQDHYSARASRYARARPTYPATLFEHLAALCPGRDLAWDCGTGNGQAAVGLAAHFRTVVATDPSTAQLAAAVPHPRVRYREASEAVSDLAPASVDLATAAQAAHWFDLDAFYAEVRRVLRPGGVVAVWCYGLCRVAPAINQLLDHFSFETVGRFWPEDRRYVDSAYRTLPFPFPALPFPEAAMEQSWTLADLGAFLETWSAVMRFTSARGIDPVPVFLESLALLWGPPEQPRLVRWPISGHIGRV